MALHSSNWLAYVIVGWPVLSLVLTPFVARFLAIAADQSRPIFHLVNEGDLAVLNMVDPTKRERAVRFPQERA